MADAHFTVHLRTDTLRRADGLIWGVRMHAPKVADLWFVINRQTDEGEELRLYRVGMVTRQCRG